MLLTKRSFLRFFFALEIVLFIGLYFFGPSSMYVARGLKKEIADIRVTIAHVVAEGKALEERIHQWQTTDFYAEKFAREQLQMARPSEQLYVITDTPTDTTVQS